MDNTYMQTRPETKVNTNALLRNAYLWMALGLAMTGVVAYLIAANPRILATVYSSGIGLFLVIAIQLGLVIFLTTKLQTMRVLTAVFSFIIYSMVTGFTLSSLFLVYTGSVISRAFFSACLMFAGMGLFAMTTKRDLSRFSSYMIMGLWGLIIASLINLIFKSSGLDYIISFVGVALFLGLTAWDTQKIIRIGSRVDPADEDNYVKLSILGALTLYLDFINIFLYLLRIFQRNDR